MNKKENRRYFHPGYYLRQDLEAMDMSPAEFARRSGISEKQVSDLVNEKIGVTFALAMKLSAFFDTSIELWINLQTAFDEYTKREERHKAIEEDYKLLNKIEPSFRNRFILCEEREGSNEEKVLKSRNVLQVGRLSFLLIPDLFVSYKELRTLDGDPLMKNVWLSLAIRKAKEEDRLLFDEKNLLESIPFIRSLSTKEPSEFYPLLKEELKGAGVHFIFLPYLSKSKLYGATKWIDGGASPAIAISNKNHTRDLFWFSLFHEISHVLMSKKNNILESTSDNDKKEIELKADRMAADMLIPKEEWDSYIKEGIFNKDSIIKFANKEGIHPSIVVGRLQKEGHIEHSYFNDIKGEYDSDAFVTA